ncbi:LysR substrate-binding domain-containing protein [Vogesella sp. LYT5W]|uniref:LysR substrate-binding domain-containing protein n=1 Tax=Vogesella margarita TaxID=2984199 RepID=A0ABT5IL61_9NEIS|nr:LysR substrate-binding domain-containing protein [Vogesella margarita]MDC7713288.1 LysR substrate-binding domain-containing protein [Vogesella margarita]
MTRRLDASLLADLWFFHAVADCGGFRRAAEQLAVTQGAVSQRVQRLESRLQLSLLQRGGRSLQLTPAGQRLYAACANGFDTVAAALAALQAEVAPASVRLSAPPSLALEWLLPRLGRFARLQPDISVDLLADNQPYSQTSLRQAGIDLALRYLPQAPLDAAFVLPEHGFPVASPGLLASGADGALLHDDAPWSSPSPAGSEWALWLAAYGRPRGSAAGERHFNQAQLAYRSAQAGDGVALGRQLLVARYLQDGSLCRLDEQPPLLLGYYALYPVSGSAAAQTLVDWLCGEMQQQ